MDRRGLRRLLGVREGTLWGFVDFGSGLRQFFFFFFFLVHSLDVCRFRMDFFGGLDQSIAGC